MRTARQPATWHTGTAPVGAFGVERVTGRVGRLPVLPYEQLAFFDQGWLADWGDSVMELADRL